jgi:hypothetical protein
MKKKIISTKPVSENALNSIRDNLEHDSNLTEESDLHSTKHSSLKNSTFEGIIIRIKSVLQNVRFPIRDNFGINTEKQTSPTRRITKSDDCYLADNLTHGGVAKPTSRTNTFPSIFCGHFPFQRRSQGIE